MDEPEISDAVLERVALAFPHSTDNNPFPSGTILGGHSAGDWARWYGRAAYAILAADPELAAAIDRGLALLKLEEAMGTPGVLRLQKRSDRWLASIFKLGERSWARQRSSVDSAGAMRMLLEDLRS